MVIGKNLRLTREDALKYLLVETGLVGSLFASVIASLSGFVIIFFILYSAKFIPFKLIEFLILLGVFVLIGVLLYFIKREEFRLSEKTSSDVFVHGLFSYPFYILVFSILFTYYLIPQWLQNIHGKEQNIPAIVITIFLVSGGFSYLFNGIWKLVAFYLFQIVADKDWFILAERDHFVSGLGLRFEEARRYGTSLSVVHFSFEKDSSLKRFFKELFKKMKMSVRDIDSIAHYNGWEDWMVLAPITESACDGLLNRMSKVIQEELVTRGLKRSIKVTVGISSLNKSVESEFDLLKPHQTIEKVIEVE